MITATRKNQKQATFDAETRPEFLRGHGLSNKVGRDIFLIVLGVLQVVFACVVFVGLVSFVLATRGYLGVGPAAPLVFLFDLWGVASGLLLIFRRSVSACRLAATWYLPIGLLLLAFAIQNSVRHPEWILESFFAAFVFLIIFAVLVVPLLPGYYPWSGRAEGMKS